MGTTADWSVESRLTNAVNYFSDLGWHSALVMWPVRDARGLRHAGHGPARWESFRKRAGPRAPELLTGRVRVAVFWALLNVSHSLLQWHRKLHFLTSVSPLYLLTVC